MPRATNAPASQRRRKRMLLAAKGYRGWRSKKFRYAKNAVWHGLTYSRFIAALKKANIALDRKILSDLATNDPKTFSAVLAATK